MSWAQVADEMREEKQALAVVNTKADAIALLDALDDAQALHLSSLMCGLHRRDTLAQVAARLKAGDACHLVSTQVVEAGVDVDFPLVLRAIGPLDRIVQAAGRCNREGRLEGLGRVVVFDPEVRRLPTGAYRTGTDETAGLLQSSDFDFDDPQVYQKYFRRFYQAVEPDAENIQNLRRSFDYPEVSHRFRMVDDDTLPVIVRPKHLDKVVEIVDGLLASIRRLQPELSRRIIRELQPYLVNVRTRLLPGYQKDGLLAELLPGLWEWSGRYDPVRGLVAENRDPDELVV